MSKSHYPVMLILSAGAFAGIFAGALVQPAHAASPGYPPYNRAAGETPSGQPVPRFVSLKFSKINGRAGPDQGYPIRWVYERKGLPVMVIAETEEWRRIEDPSGSQSWVRKRMLDGRRTALVRPTRDMRTSLRAAPNSDSRILAYLADGVIAEILEERPGWREIKVGRYKGWAPAAELWGAGPR
jgi:SH3-like domain-containing protein